MNAKLPPCLCLAGPTASGKTALALALAQRLPLEIISVDSALVYRGMDIGTAKPSAEELRRVPHHLIDIRDPAQAYSAAEFARDACQLAHDIAARGRLPLLVGGTMLYFKALLQGMDEMPPSDAERRAQIDARARAEGWPALHAELARVDPITAARLAPQDAQRIQRALEVWQLTGRPISDFHTRSRQSAAEPTRSASAADRPEACFISLEPRSRAWLHERIAQRFDAMLAAGFLDEVRRLRARGDLHADMPAMRCVGYRQAWAVLAGELPEAELRERGIFATRQLAKRQLTWLRNWPDREAWACDDPAAQEAALGRLVERGRALLES